jgi:hypothetical protein
MHKNILMKWTWISRDKWAGWMTISVVVLTPDCLYPIFLNTYTIHCDSEQKLHIGYSLQLGSVQMHRYLNISSLPSYIPWSSYSFKSHQYITGYHPCFDSQNRLGPIISHVINLTPFLPLPLLQEVLDTTICISLHIQLFYRDGRYWDMDI